MEHGRDLDGLAPSTYEATLHFNLGDGYPIGVFVPFGVGARSSSATDAAWLIQPYMAFARGAAGARRSGRSRTPLRRLAAACARWRRSSPRSRRCSSATTSGAGSRRSIAAALIAGFAALADRLAERPRGPARCASRRLLVAAALRRRAERRRAGLAALPAAGRASRSLLGARVGAATRRARRCAVAAALGVLALPADRLRGAAAADLVAAHRRRRARQPGRAARAGAGRRDLARGRLPLRPRRRAGHLRADRGRLSPPRSPGSPGRGAGGEPGAARSTSAARWSSCAALVVVGSPWVGGKALATASPAIPFAAMLGAGWLASPGRRLAAAGARGGRSPAGSCGRTRSATATSASRRTTSSPSSSGSASGSRARGRR